MKTLKPGLSLKKLGIDTYREAVVYIRKDCPICRSEGFETHARILVTLHDRSIIATLNSITSDLLNPQEASLSAYAWKLLNANEGETIYLSHPKPLKSHDLIRNKINGCSLNQEEMNEIVTDLVAGYLSDIYISAFLAACANAKLTEDEIFYLTKSMINTGSRLTWPGGFVVDKHCVGGLPGNRTSLIIVPIVTAFGLVMPKTSSYSITSPAGTADTMKVFAPVELEISAIHRVVEQEKGCIIWGDSVGLSPADDLFIRIEKTLNLDSDGQLIASVLSKKMAAGSTHIVIDIPIGPTAKVKDLTAANGLKNYFENVAKKLGIIVRVFFSDGNEPVGRGMGPVLEARDVLAVLQCAPDAPQNLREHALTLAGHVLELSSDVSPGTGKNIATDILNSGRAFKKFQAICQAQGGMFELKMAPYTFSVLSRKKGVVKGIDNQRLATIAKLAGAPHAKAAGVALLTPLGTSISLKQPLYIIHAETLGELHYAVHYTKQEKEIIYIETQS
jgi:thymidine phosphorylase